jgi:hypothetical protein
VFFLIKLPFGCIRRENIHIRSGDLSSDTKLTVSLAAK